MMASHNPQTFSVRGIGSCMMSQAATGVGALQKPLKDIYIPHRNPANNQPAKDMKLEIGPAGMKMLFRDAVGRPDEILYKMNSILFWDAVQFVTVKNPGDKKNPIKCAFEPLDNDHSRNKVNLFSPLDKKHAFLTKQRHPAMFTCAIRRTEGVKALDVHAFVCGSDDEALALVQSFNDAQDAYKSGEVSETGVFGYKPFQSPMGRSQSVKSLHTAGLSTPVSPTEPSVEPAARSDAEPPPPRRAPSQKIGRAPFLLPSPIQSSPAVNSLPKRVPTESRGHVLQLTQADFLSQDNHVSPTRGRSSSAGDNPGSSGTPSPDYETADTPELPLKHLRDRLNNSGSGDGGKRGGGAASSSSSSVLPQRGGGAVSSASSSSSSGGGGGGGVSRKDARWPPPAATTQECDTSTEEDQPPLSVAQRSQQWNARERKATSPPQRGKSKSFYTPGQKEPAVKSRVAVHRHYSVSTDELEAPPHYKDAAAREATVELDRRGSRVGGGGGDVAPQLPPRNPAPSHVIGGSRLSVSHVDVRSIGVDSSDLDSRPPVETRPIAVLPDRATSGAGHHDNRPVAKVPPHKVLGQRVLPQGPVLPMKAKHGVMVAPDKTTTTTSSNTMERDSSVKGIKHFGGFTPRKSKSQYFNDKNSASSSSSTSSAERNWQFREASEGSKSKEGMEAERRGYDGSKHLMVGQKKDAEIASVLQDMKFNYNDKTMSPGMPAGNNFEKSLGYFP